MMPFTAISRLQRLSPWIALVVSLLHPNLFQIDAFTPPQGLRLRDFRRGRYFSEEHVLPPLDSTTGSSTSRMTPRRQIQHHSHHYRGAGNGTMDTASTWTIPYSSQDYMVDDEDYDQPLITTYTNDPKVFNQWLAENVPMDCCALGFDTESVPDAPWIQSKYKGRPATIQLSTTTASIVIPLLVDNRYSRACVPLLETVLMDETIIKCGVGLDDDLVDLRRYVPGMKYLQARSRFDVGLLGASKNRLGLKALSRILLQRKLEKPKRITVSDWSKSPLSDEQVAYGARDAWCGAAVFEELQRLYPETFETEALIDFLRSQPSIRELAARRQERKKAKQLLSQYRESYRDRDVMPRRVKRRVSKLRQILKDKQVEVDSVEVLGFIIDESQR